MDEKPPCHIAVLCGEVVRLFDSFPGGILADGTLGGGGHAESLLEAYGDRIDEYVGIDRDAEAVEAARRRLERFGGKVTCLRGNFRRISDLLGPERSGRVGGILLDLGFSSLQLDRAERGFSYREEGPLDMRMNRESGVSAFEVVNSYPEEKLAAVLREFGEVRGAGAIARAIARERGAEPIRETGRLARAVSRRIPARRRNAELARIFQAIRIEVNDELGALAEGLERGFPLLAPRGLYAVIAYHSLEDRLVKRTMSGWSKGCVCPPDFPVCRCGRKPVATRATRGAIKPGEDEIDRNSRARSARLRAVVRLEQEGEVA